MKFSLASALTSCALVALGYSTASADAPKAPLAVASAEPTSTPKPKPERFTLGGQVRAYQFDREYPSQLPATHSASSTNFSGLLRANYRFATGLTLGASYFGAEPFGLNGLHAERNGLADNSLPGATLSTFPETYLKYQTPLLIATLGNQIINEKWLPNSDTRLKPTAYEGIEASYNGQRTLR